MDVLLHNKLQKAKINTSKGKINFFQCRRQHQCRCLYIGTKIQVQKIECEHYSKNFKAFKVFKVFAFDFSKAKSQARRWRTAWCFQIFLMAVHLFLFMTIFFKLTFCMRCTKKCCVAQKNYAVSTKKYFT